MALTQTELKRIKCIARGDTDAEVARQENVSYKAIKLAVDRVCGKLGIHNEPRHHFVFSVQYLLTEEEWATFVAECRERWFAVPEELRSQGHVELLESWISPQKRQADIEAMPVKSTELRRLVIEWLVALGFPERGARSHPNYARVLAIYRAAVHAQRDPAPG